MDILYTLIYWLHTVSSIYWIGGIIFILFIFIPTSKQQLGNEAGVLIGAVSKKFKLHVNICIIALIVTGIALSILSPYLVKIEKSSNSDLFIIVKHLLFGIMICIHIYRNTLLIKKINLEKEIVRKNTLQRFSMNLVKTILILGLTVIFLSILASKLK